MGSDLTWGQASRDHSEAQKRFEAAQRTIIATVERAEKAEAEVARLTQVLADVDTVMAIAYAIHHLERRLHQARTSFASGGAAVDTLDVKLRAARGDLHMAVGNLKRRYSRWEIGEAPPWQSKG